MQAQTDKHSLITMTRNVERLVDLGYRCVTQDDNNFCWLRQAKHAVSELEHSYFNALEARGE